MKTGTNKKTLCLLPLLLVMFLSTGCLGSREINDMAIISGAGFDRDPRTGQYQVSAEIVNKNASLSEGGSETEKIQASGLTVADAIQNCSFTDSRKAYWSHAKVFIISQDLAREQGIGSLLDYVIRNYKARLSIDLLVSDLPDAGSVLDLSTASTNIKAFDLEEMLKTDLESAGAAPLKVYQAIDQLNTDGVEMTIPMVRERSVAHADDQNPSNEAQGSGTSSEGSDSASAAAGGTSGAAGSDSSASSHDQMAEIAGTAAFRGDKMVGTLSPDETVPLLFLQDRLERAHLALPEKMLSIDINNSRTKVIPHLSHGELSIEVEITAGASVSQMKGGSLDTKAQREKAAAQIEAAIDEDCLNLITRVQKEIQSDLFGFGKVIRKQSPERWKEVREDWNTQGFPKLNVTVSTKIYLDPGETTAGQILEGRN